MTDDRARSRSTATAGWRIIKGGIGTPQGYLAAGVSAGIKKKGLDLAVVFSSQPSTASGVFTRNRVKAAPVVLSGENLIAARGRMRAILINSGCANACTGERGMRDALLSTQSLASHLGIDPGQVLVASTGVIGRFLPVRRMLKGIAAAVSSLNSNGGGAAAQAIMTTDTHEKSFAVEGRIGGKTVRIGGMAKGSGMINPQMATMLAVLTTDVNVPAGELKRMLRRAADRTFNCLTVDGDTSTNDTAFLMANGASGAVLTDSRSRSFFEKGLIMVCEELAKSIARDGEGATKFVEITVSGAASFEDARKAAMAVANSSLVKTALYGQEFNWGRIICAVGYSGVVFDPEQIMLSFNGMAVFRHGAPVNSCRTRAEKAMRAKDIRIEIDLRRGKSSAKVWTCDLSREYVEINASYIS
ncbi:MAG TPA: bifunctional glutamate N-acetyltransferase/amino-acid acetyltransferase ArgJ [Acidobacteriota bacterium]|nr:bifunctional glutamate N-acetyltransferase/amino-acid acetyltransferase ArgJ [Acidobacteriota bacterium]